MKPEITNEPRTCRGANAVATEDVQQCYDEYHVELRIQKAIQDSVEELAGKINDAILALEQQATLTMPPTQLVEMLGVPGAEGYRLACRTARYLVQLIMSGRGFEVDTTKSIALPAERT